MATDKRDVDGPEYDYFDAVDDDDEQGTRGPVFAVVGLIVLVAFMGVVWVAYHQGVRNGRQQPPLIVAEGGPIKEVPTDTGAQPEPESPALNALGGEPPKAPEVLMPPPETPIAPPAPDVAMPPPSDTIGGVEADEPVPDAVPAPKPDTAAAAPAPAATPAAVPSAPAPAAVAAGDFLVQIAAFRSDVEAQQAWTKLQAKNEDLLSAYAPNVAQADLGAKGIYFRLRFGPFKDRADAISVCESLKARKQDCLVVKAS